MRRIASPRLAVPAIALAAALLPGSLPARADSITRTTLEIDATDPEALVIETQLTWTAAEGSPRPSLRLHLARGVEVESVAAEGQELPFDRDDKPGSFVAWNVRLPLPLGAGESRSLSLRTRIDAATRSSLPGVRIGEDGGFLMPGTGWFPRTGPDGAESAVCSVIFRLPDGWTGIGPGERSEGRGPWSTRAAVRPYAVWGEYQRTVVEGEPELVAYRRPGREGDPPRVERLRQILRSIELGVGPSVEAGEWKLVDVGPGAARGGARTLFWDEAEVAAVQGELLEFVDRELAVGLAHSYWTECLRLRGDAGYWLGEGFARFLGDMAVISLDPSEDREPIESRLIGSRRDIFLQNLEDDRALRGLDPLSPEAEAVLDGRGGLVAHLVSSVGTNPTSWMLFLSSIREARDGTEVTWEDFLADLGDRFPNQAALLRPLVDGTDLPDFRIAEHGPSTQGRGNRYRVAVENVGPITGSVDVAIYTPRGQHLRTYRATVPAGETRAVLFRDAARLGRIRLDPRGMVPQVDLEGEEVVLVPEEEAGAEEKIVPSFPIKTSFSFLAEVSSFGMEVAPGIRIENFDGHLQWHQTYHGPSAISLLGHGTVVLEPTGELGADFRKERGRDSLEFDAEEMWVRFALAKWDEIEPLLGKRVRAGEVGLVPRCRRIRQFSFSAAFADGAGLAQIPPPGAGLVCFGIGAGERRAILRTPEDDGRWTMRLWDRLRGSTIWEATR
jgi:hypothetical protein